MQENGVVVEGDGGWHRGLGGQEGSNWTAGAANDADIIATKYYPVRSVHAYHILEGC